MSKYSKEEQQQKNQFRDFLIERGAFKNFCREIKAHSGSRMTFGEFVRNTMEEHGTLFLGIDCAFLWAITDQGLSYWQVIAQTWRDRLSELSDEK